MSESDFALGFKQGRAVEHAVMLEMIENIKSEINEIDSMTFIGNGSGCASEMRTECLKIIDRICEESEDT